MSKHLVIAEKPSVARDIARVLHCNKKTNNYIEGNDYVVTWALGHLVTLADPEEYGKEYQTWSMDTLPMLPEYWKLVVIKQTGKQYHAIKDLIYRKDISDIIIALSCSCRTCRIRLDRWHQCHTCTDMQI